MESLDYRIAWGIYILTGIAISIILWRGMKKYLWRELAYLLQTFLIAIIFTPWYVIAEEDLLAPAIIVFAMDTITIDAQAGIRGLIPLVMAFMLALIITAVLSIIYRVKKRKRDKVEAIKKQRFQEKTLAEKKLGKTILVKRKVSIKKAVEKKVMETSAVKKQAAKMKVVSKEKAGS